MQAERPESTLRVGRTSLSLFSAVGTMMTIVSDRTVLFSFQRRKEYVKILGSYRRNKKACSCVHEIPVTPRLPKRFQGNAPP